MKVEIAPLEEYLRTVSKTMDGKVADTDPEVYSKVLSMCKEDELLKSELDCKVHFIPERSFIGYQEREGIFEFPLNYMSHRKIWYSAKDIVETAPIFARHLKDSGNVKPIMLDTFETPDLNEYENYFLWLNSPITELKPTIEEYLSSLSQKRRYQVKKRDLDLTTQMVTELRDEEKQFVRDNLHERWFKESYFESTYLQILFAYASSSTKYLLAHTEDDTLACIAIFTERDRQVFFHALIQNNSLALKGIGKFMLSRAVEYYTFYGEGIKILDPTCKTNVDDDDFNIYKRLLVNTNKIRPVCYIQGEITQDFILPPYCDHNGWKLNDKKVVIYDGV